MLGEDGEISPGYQGKDWECVAHRGGEVGRGEQEFGKIGKNSWDWPSVLF